MKDIRRGDIVVAKSKMKRAPKGMGHYFMTDTGKYAWRKRKDNGEKYLSADTPKELQEQINEVIDLKVLRSKLKVDEVFTKWLVYIDNLRKKATYNQYRDIYAKHIKPEIGNRKLSGITPSDIQDVILSMNKKTTKTRKKKDGKWIEVDTEKSISTWTMKHAKKIMNGCFKYAIKERLLSKNPVSDPDYKIAIPNKQAKSRKTLNSEELVKLLRQVEKSRWVWSLKFMLVTGMRRGEMLALKWSDVDKVNKRITIEKSDSSTGLDGTKSKKVHYIPLSPLMEKYLAGQKQMLQDEPNPILNNEKLKVADLIFPNERGVMLKPGSYYTMLSRYAEKAGIYATPHCLRHTFVYMNRKKLSLKELQNILGHDESTTTLDIYGDMIDESTDATAKQIDETFADLDKKIDGVEDESINEAPVITKTEKIEKLKVVDISKYRKTI
jgi:integrase